jgi:hypothetical protein
LSNPLVRHALGLGSNRQLIFTHERNEVDAALRQFLLDAMPTSDGSKPRVHSRTNNIERARYAHEFSSRGFSPQTPLPRPTVPKRAEPEAKEKRPRNLPDPGKRRYLIPSGFICNMKDKNVLMLFKEMQRTEIDDHEFACSFLLRAFIERVMILYMQRAEQNFVPPQKDHQLVDMCSKHLDPSGKSPKFKNMRVAASDADAAHSLHTLGAAVHATHLMSRKALIAAWGNWEFALTRMMEPTAKV